MTLQEKLEAELKEAFRGGDTIRVGVFRLLITAIRNKAIEKREGAETRTLSDEEVLKVLASEAKKRKESIEIFTKGLRTDLVEKEKQELRVIEAYLPAKMSEAEIVKIVVSVMEKNPSEREFGTLMKIVLSELAGRGDARVVSEILKKKLAALS